MTKWGILLVIAAFALMMSTAVSQPRPAAKKTAFSSLKIGQPVVLKEKGPLFEISWMDGDLVGNHTVVEVGEDYIVLRDVAAVTESHIPIYAIRAIVHIRTKVNPAKR